MAPNKASKTRDSSGNKASGSLNKKIKNKIKELAETHDIKRESLEEFALFVITCHKEKDPKPLTITKLKKAVFDYFKVDNLAELKRSGSFKMATDGMSTLNFTNRGAWENLYREFVGILPEEENDEGYGCINGINIFYYFKPWRVFNLDPQKATQDDIKRAYRELSKIYHPDAVKTGDAKVFDRIHTMYRSISAEA